MIDIHSHILPNIDDGSRTLEDSIKMIKEAYNSGFTSIVSTSHFIEDSYNCPKNERLKLINKIQKILDEEKINIKIYNGAEAYITPNLINLINENLLPTINDTKYLLMELPMYNEILYLNSLISNLLSNNIIPIIAHPERYSYVQNNYKILYPLLDMGVLFQSNYASIIGLYGNSAEKTFKKLLKNNMIHFLASDVHRPNTIYPKMNIILKKIEKIIGKEKLEILSEINPKKILLGSI